MKIPKTKYSKASFKYIEDGICDSFIPILYGTVSAIEAKCINTNQDTENRNVIAQYKLPIGCIDYGTAYVESGDVMKPTSVVSVDYSIGIIYVSNGRETSGSTNKLKLVNPVGYSESGHCYPEFVIKHLLRTFLGKAYTDSNFNKTQFESELRNTGIQKDIGFLIDSDIDFWEQIYNISISSGMLFRVYYDARGRITAKAKDFSRASSGIIPSCQIKNSNDLELSSDRSGVYSSVLVKYGKNYYDDDSFLSLENSTYRNDVLKEYATDEQYEIESYLTNEADAVSRSDIEAQVLSVVPMTCELELFGNNNREIFDIVTCSLQADNLNSNSRQFSGNKDCLILSISPDYEKEIDNITVLIIPNRTPKLSQTAVNTSSFTTVEREQSSLDIVEEIANNAASGVVIIENGSPSEPPDSVENVSVFAYRDYVEVLFDFNGTGLKNSIKDFVIEYAKDGTTWVTTKSIDKKYQYTIDRDVDGYPESTDFSLWRFRVKAENIYGYVSADYFPNSTGQAIDTSKYETWIPSVPDIIIYANGREAVLNWNAINQYGQSGYDLQIARTSITPIEADWKKPVNNLDSLASEDNYTDGTDGVLFTSINKFSQALPLVGQSTENPVNTKYWYRIRGVSATPTTALPNDTTNGSWSGGEYIIVVPSIVPVYRGRYFGVHPTVYNTGDWWLVYNDEGESGGSNVPRGIYYVIGTTITLINPTDTNVLLTKYRVSTLEDVLYASNNGYTLIGTVNDPVTVYGVQTIAYMAVNAAFITYLGTNTIRISDAGAIVGGSRYNDSGTVIDATKAGVYIAADGTVKFECEAGGFVINATLGTVTYTGVNIDLTDSALVSYEEGSSTPKSFSHENLALVVRDSDGTTELSRLQYQDSTGLWGGRTLGGEVDFVSTWIKNATVGSSSTFVSTTYACISLWMENGYGICLFTRGFLDNKLYEKVYSNGAWGETVDTGITATASGLNSIVKLPDGRHLITVSYSYVIRATDGTYGSVITISLTDEYCSLNRFQDNTINLITVAAGTGYLMSRTWNGAGFNTAVSLGINDVSYPVFCKTVDKSTLTYRKTSTGKLFVIDCSDGTYPAGTDTTKTANYGQTQILPDGTYRMLYSVFDAGLYSAVGTTLGSLYSTTLETSGSSEVALCFRENGETEIIYGSTSTIKSRFDSSAYAGTNETKLMRAGMGFIESGIDTYGEYYKTSDGGTFRPSATGAHASFMSNTETSLTVNGIASKTSYSEDGTPILALTATHYYDMTIPNYTPLNATFTIQARSKISGGWIDVEKGYILSLFCALRVQTLNSSGAFFIRGFQVALKTSATNMRLYIDQVLIGGTSAWSGTTTVDRSWATMLAASDGFDRWRIKIS